MKKIFLILLIIVICIATIVAIDWRLEEKYKRECSLRRNAISNAYDKGYNRAATDCKRTWTLMPIHFCKEKKMDDYCEWIQHSDWNTPSFYDECYTWFQEKTYKHFK